MKNTGERPSTDRTNKTPSVRQGAGKGWRASHNDVMSCGGRKVNKRASAGPK